MKLASVYADKRAPRVLYEILKDRPDYANISHSVLPKWRDHILYIKSKPMRVWYLIKIGNDYVGQVSATRNNEIGIAILTPYRGKGYARQAIEKLMARHKPLPAVRGRRYGNWVANINPKNAPSIALFEKAGFKHIQNTYTL